MGVLERGVSSVPTEGPTLLRQNTRVLYVVTRMCTCSSSNTPRPIDEGSKAQTLFQVATAPRASAIEHRLHCVTRIRVGCNTGVVHVVGDIETPPLFSARDQTNAYQRRHILQPPSTLGSKTNAVASKYDGSATWPIGNKTGPSGNKKTPVDRRT